VLTGGTSRSTAGVLAKRRDLPHQLRGLDHPVSRRGRRGLRRPLRRAGELRRSGRARARVERAGARQHGPALPAQEMGGAAGGRVRALAGAPRGRQPAHARRRRACGAAHRSARSPVYPGRNAGVPRARRLSRSTGVLGRGRWLWPLRLRQSQHARVIDRLAFCARGQRSDSSWRRLSGDPAWCFSRDAHRTRIASAHM
jgi:hypothetical protein